MSEIRIRRSDRYEQPNNPHSVVVPYSQFVANPHYISIKDGPEGYALRDFLRKAKIEKEECEHAYPSFDFSKEISNKDFRSLLDSGHTVMSAYETLHPELSKLPNTKLTEDDLKFYSSLDGGKCEASLRHLDTLLNPPEERIFPTVITPHKYKGLHWFVALLIKSFLYTVTIQLFMYFSSPFSVTLVQQYNASLQTVLDILYYFFLILAYLFHLLWIRLTYKRYRTAAVWKAYTFITIVLSPLIYYGSNLTDLAKLSASSTLLSSSMLSSVHLAISYLLALIPLFYLLYAISKKE